MNFHVGQKVVCVDNKHTPKPVGHWEEWKRRFGVTKPIRGEVYTIREIAARKNGGLRLRLVEIVNPPAEFRDAPAQEPWFWAENFRPVKTTSIEIFEQMLAPEPNAPARRKVKERADV